MRAQCRLGYEKVFTSIYTGANYQGVYPIMSKNLENIGEAVKKYLPIVVIDMEEVGGISLADRIVAIGDSITYGFPYSYNESWVNYLAKKLAIEILNKGVCGDFTGDMLRRFHRDVINNRASHVIIMGGINDVLWNTPVEKVQDNIIAMCQLAKENKIEIIVGITTPTNDHLAEKSLKTFRQWLFVLAEENHYRKLDFYNVLLNNQTGYIDDRYSEDGVHPNKLGYQAMSQLDLDL